jgi:hypothetical protein
MTWMCQNSLENITSNEKKCQFQILNKTLNKAKSLSEAFVWSTTKQFQTRKQQLDICIFGDTQ